MKTQIKKTAERLIAIFMCITLMYAMSANAIHAAKDTESISFSDTFDDGSMLWELTNMSISNGNLKTTFSGSDMCSAKLKGAAESYWSDYELSLCFSIPEYAGGWVQLHIGAENFIIRPSGIWDYSTGKEIYLTKLKLENDIYYTLKVYSNNGKVRIELYNGDKKEAEAVYTNIAERKKGVLRFITFVSHLTIDSVTVKETTESIKVNKKIVSLGVAEKLTLSASAETERWYSSDENIATVDSDGNVTAVKKGVAQITVIGKNGETDTCNVVVYVKPESAYFTYDLSVLHEGENYGIGLKLLPADADNGCIVWTSTDSDVLQVAGNMNSRKSLIAKRKGSAVINVDTIDGIRLASCPIMVFDNTAKSNNQTGYAVLSATGRKISDLLFGVHCPSPDKLGTEEKALVTNFGFDFLRTFSADPLNENIYETANENNIPVVIGLNVMNKTIDRLVSEVEAMHNNLNNNDTIYVELGNEVYNNIWDPSFVDEYINKCTNISGALREYAKNNNFKIKIAACILTNEFSSFPKTNLLGIWNDKIAQNSDFYDALVVHNYTAFENCDGMTQGDAMKYMYGHNEYTRRTFQKYEELFPGKEFWYTEYGNLINDVFSNSDRSERGRLQFGNSVGVALANMEKLLDMAAYGIDMSSYHCLIDVQGFGIVGPNMFKYPTYYTFEECAKLFKECDYIYSTDAVYSNTEYLRKYLSNEYNDVGVWGLGDENTVKYAIISNRSADEINFSLENYDIKPIWSYSGNEVLEGFLEPKESMYVQPSNVPEPKLPKSDITHNTKLDGYSITVCELYPNKAGDNTYVSINKDIFNHLCDSIRVQSSGTLNNDDIKLYAGGKEKQISLEGDNVYEIKPVSGFEYNTNYSLNINNTEYTFKTIDKPLFESYKGVKSYNFEDNAANLIYEADKWSVANGKLYKSNKYPYQAATTEKYNDFLLTFDVYPESVDESYLELKMRGGFVRIQFHNSELRSYYNKKNDNIIGKFPQYDGGMTVKAVAYDNFILLWTKGVSDMNYEYIGKVAGIPESENIISFGGYGTYFLDNINISTDATDETILVDDDFSENYGLWDIPNHAWAYSDGRLLKYNECSIHTKSKNAYDNYTMTLDIIPEADSADYAEIELKNGFVRFLFKYNKEIRTYYNGKNDTIVGTIPKYESIITVKFKVIKNRVYLWCKTDINDEWKYITRIDTNCFNETQIAFRGEGIFAIDNVLIKSALSGDISYITFFDGTGDKHRVARPLENTMVSVNRADGMGTVFAVIYDKDKMVRVYSADADKIENISLGGNENLRLFAWDSINGLSPLGIVYASPDRSFFE